MPSSTPLLSVAFVAAIALAAPQAAHADCLEDFQSSWDKHVDVRTHLDDQDQRNLRTLRRAAVVLRAEGRDDACEEVSEAVDDMLEDRREKLTKEGVILSQSEQVRMERYRSARPLSESGVVVRSSDLVGAELRNMKGERLGEVDDLYIDSGESNVSYLIVERGGFLGIGEDTVAIPANRVAVTEDSDTVLLDVTRESFEQAPALKDRQMIHDPAWRQQNTDFFAPK